MNVCFLILIFFGTLFIIINYKKFHGSNHTRNHTANQSNAAFINDFELSTTPHSNITGTPECETINLGNGWCDELLNVPKCYYDGG